MKAYGWTNTQKIENKVPCNENVWSKKYMKKDMKVSKLYL